MTFSKKIMAMMMLVFMVLGFGAIEAEKAFAATPKKEAAASTYTVPFDSNQTKDLTDSSDLAGETTALGGLVGTMYKFATYISGLIFGVSVIMIVWAGFKYATSQGEQKTMETAKMQIITAGIGIGVALLAMVIVKVFAEIYNV